MRFIPRTLGRVSSAPISGPLATNLPCTLAVRAPQSQPSRRSVNGLSSRTFTTTPLRSKPKTMGQIKARNSTGPFSWKAGMLFVLTGAGLLIYFRVEKERLERKRITELSKGVGKPKVGGPFTLMDLDGNVVTEEELKGRYCFVWPFCLYGMNYC